MMKICLEITYNAKWGENLNVSSPAIKKNALPMTFVGESVWSVLFEVADIGLFEYFFLVKNSDGEVVRQESVSHQLYLEDGQSYVVNNLWQDDVKEKYIFSSAFKNCFFYHKPEVANLSNDTNVSLKVRCYKVDRDYEVCLLGEGILGDWKVENAIPLQSVFYGFWQVSLNLPSNHEFHYKFIIRDKETKEIHTWEDGENRVLTIDNIAEIYVQESFFRGENLKWKYAGTAIPVFSIRTENSFGIGEFPDLKLIVDFATLTGQRVIQILPINDTTTVGKWTDSYPYNAISIYALHPIYLGLSDFPLKDKDLYLEFRNEAKRLNQLEQLDYEAVFSLKKRYTEKLYQEIGEKTLRTKEFGAFFNQNEYWLFSYACFSFLREKYGTANHSSWGEYQFYDKQKLTELSDGEAENSIRQIYFVQYLLHLQLTDVKEYANERGVVLKGDIPIGVNRNSVEVWEEPHLFNLDTQTGAPPDDFSIEGQNWGFPTYNWGEMAKDGYSWWVKRFQKMADYFDAYRIDHILGFFRIWEIPDHAVQGLLGYFSPAKPFSVEELTSLGFSFDEKQMTQPYIDKILVDDVFCEKSNEIINTYLEPCGDLYLLKDKCDTQQKIKNLVENENVRNGLYKLCSQVLFVRDKKEPNKFHPRISAQYTSIFKSLSIDQQMIFNGIYEDFFYHRHTQFWRDEAMKKLPILINATEMLVCGEDLGMIPDCVPAVMNELQILSLEIQQMPKTFGVEFENLSNIPYLSVCTTSTHDMAPLRMWWQEDKEKTQRYYNSVLKHNEEAPLDCTTTLCAEIVAQHLASPAMLTVLPLQDWLSMSDQLRNKKPNSERINIPAIANHYWRYRMHLFVKNIIENEVFVDCVKKKIKKIEN